MVHGDGAVLVNIDECAALVEHGGGEADAELEWHQRQAAFFVLALFVVARNVHSALAIARFFFQLVHHLVGNEVFNRLVVLRRHAGRIARHGWVLVEVYAAHIQRVQAQLVGDLLDHRLNAKHALRPAKTAKRRGALHVRLAAVADDGQIGQEIAVVNVQHGAVVHRAREIGAVTAARSQHHVDAEDAARVVVAALVVDAKVMPLAGNHHVVVTVHAQLHRLLQLERSQRGALAEDAGIAFLAPKRTAHSAANHLHIFRAEVQRGSGFALVAVGVLGGHIQRELAVLARHGVGDLAFQIKLLLLAAFGTALELVRGFGNGVRWCAPGNALGRHDEILGRHGLVNREDGGQLLDLHHRTLGGFPRVEHVVRHHQRHRLAQKLHLASGQERVVMDDGAAVVFTGDVFGSKHRHHAVLRQNGRAINAFADQLAMRYRRRNKGRVERATQLGDVVGVHRSARHMQVRRLVRQFAALLSGRHQLFKRRRGVHAANSSCKDSSTNRITRLRATSER